MVVDKKRDGLLICVWLYPQDSETGPKLSYTEASFSYNDDQGQSLCKYPRDVMLHIILTSEMLHTNVEFNPLRNLSMMVIGSV
jgi:hypothetical protein